MKKNTRILLLGVITAWLSILGVARAQTIVWSDNLDDGNGNSRWYADNGVWQIGTPTIGPGSAHSTNYCATTGLTANYPTGANSRLIRIQTFVVPAANQSPRLRFWQWYNFGANCCGSDYGVVEIKGTSGTWQAASPQYAGNGGGWTYASVDLSAYAGQTVQIAFHMVYMQDTGHTIYGAPGWYVDEIAFETGQPVFNNPEGFENGIGDWYAETGSWQVGVPTSGPGTAHAGTNCVATILNGNYPVGANSRFISPAFIVPAANQYPRLRFWQWYNFAANCCGSDYGVVEIKGTNGTWQAVSPGYYGNGGGWTYASVDLSAYAGQSVQIAFHMVYGQNTSYTINGASGWYVDDVNLNTGAPVFNNPEGFETGLGDWHAETGSWQVGVPTKANGPSTNSVGSQAHTGINCAVTLLNGNYPGGVNSRFISPAFQVPPANTNPYLRFWHWFSFACNCCGCDSGVVEIKAGTNAWVAVATNTGSSGGWSSPFVDLTSYAGQTVQIAFHIIYGQVTSYTTYGAAGWYVDDVQVFPYVIPVGPANPLSAISNTNILETVPWQYTPTVSGSGYTFGLSNAPSGMTVNASSGTISWTPTEAQGPSTNANITYAVYQSSTTNTVAWTNFTVVVLESNLPPVFLSTPGLQTVYATTTLNVSDGATDPDQPANTLTYAIVSSSPTGVGINPNTGLVSWTPNPSQVGLNTIYVSVTDYNPWAVNSQSLSVTNSFQVQVLGLTPPTWTNQPVSSVIGGGGGFSFTAQATGYPTPTYQWQFSTNNATWVSINGATGANYSLATSGTTNIGFYRLMAANSQATNYSSVATLGFIKLNMLASVYLTGAIGSNYRIDAAPQLAPTNWVPVTNITIPSQPYIYVDYTSVTNKMQFYRAVPQ